MCYQPLKSTYPILEFQIFLLYDQLTYYNSQREYVKFHLRKPKHLNQVLMITKQDKFLWIKSSEVLKFKWENLKKYRVIMEESRYQEDLGL